VPVVPEATLTREVIASLGDRPGPTVAHEYREDAVPTPLHGVERLLRKRHAVRSFDCQDLPAEQLAQIMGTARDCYRAQWPAAGDDLCLLLTTRSASGPGNGAVHSVDLSAPPRTDPVPVGDCHELPQLYADAPALLLVCGDLGGPAAAAYPDLLVRAGALGHAIWLAGLAAGLDGCVFGRAHHRISQLAHQVRPGYRHLFTVALGHPDE